MHRHARTEATTHPSFANLLVAFTFFGVARIHYRGSRFCFCGKAENRRREKEREKKKKKGCFG